jgi:hypothetical protein
LNIKGLGVTLIDINSEGFSYSKKDIEKVIDKVKTLNENYKKSGSIKKIRIIE